MSKPRKTFYHSTVSRRDFMKLVGMGTFATVGGSLLEAPFKDLDEMMASPIAERKLPFWVKEVDEPTVKIDWDNMEIFPHLGMTLFNPGSWPEGEWQKIQASNRESTIEKVRNNEPGYSLKDYALGDANSWGWMGEASIAPSWTGPDVQPLPVNQHPTMFYTPEDFGVPKYQGTPEENSRMLRVAGRILGAADMGFVKLDEKTKKLLYGFVQFEDVEQGYEKEDGTKVLPDKDLWVIVSLMPQSLWMAQYTDKMTWAKNNVAAYSRTNVYSNRVKVFLRGLGYQHYGGSTVSLGRAVGFGVMAGLAEYGRHNMMVSPQYGTNFRTVMLTVTDLPLAVTKPIDAGITNFCRTCMKCAEMCPSGAISMSKEPFWGGDPPYQAKGIEGWYLDDKKCYAHGWGGEPDCGVCQAVCPFSKFDEAVMHDLMRASISTTPALNNVISKLDDVFGYGEQKTGSPWDVDPNDIPLFGLDTSRS